MHHSSPRRDPLSSDRFFRVDSGDPREDSNAGFVFVERRWWHQFGKNIVRFRTRGARSPNLLAKPVVSADHFRSAPGSATSRIRLAFYHTSGSYFSRGVVDKVVEEKRCQGPRERRRYIKNVRPVIEVRRISSCCRDGVAVSFC